MSEDDSGFKQDYVNVSASTMIAWQEIIDFVASISNARAGLIMRVVSDEIEVFVASHNEGNPYSINEKENLYDSGLYCEKVINTQSKLLIPNALKSERT